jgi:hypothetical protein
MLTTLLGWIIGLALSVVITYAAVSPIIMVFGMLGRSFVPKPIPRKIKKPVKVKRAPVARRPINTGKTSAPAVKTEVKEDTSPLINRLFMGSTGSSATVEEVEMFSKLSKKELIELSKTTRTYDPRYKIEDLLQFGD